MRRIVVTYTRREFEVLSVDLPAGASRQDGRAAADAVVEAHRPEWAEGVEWEWSAGEPEWVHPAWPTDPSLLTEHAGRAWATTGAYALREDCPLPSGTVSLYDRWREEPGLASALGSLVYGDVPEGLRFDPALAPVLRAGRVVGAAAHGVAVPGVAVLDEAGEPMAIVMPRKRGWGGIDWRGEVVDG